MTQAVTEGNGLTGRVKQQKQVGVVPSVAGSLTHVSATLVDIGGTVWASAYITIRFVPTANIPGPYFWGSDPLVNTIDVTRSDPNGAFQVDLPDNLTITPAGSMWQFIISPNATMPAVIFNLMVAGSSMDISSIFTSQSYQVQNALVQGFVLPRAYSDAEVAAPPFAGALYYDSTAHEVKVWVGQGGWFGLLGTGFSEVPPGTLASSKAGGFWHAQGGFPDGPREFANQPQILVIIGGMQIITSGTTNSYVYYFRTYNGPAGGWQQWTMVSGTTEESVAVDLNNMLVAGTNLLSGGVSANAPSDIINATGSILEVFVAPGPVFAQRLMCPLDPNHFSSIYHRVYNGGWSTWYELVGTQV